MFKRIDHIEIIPHDFDRAIGFYTEVLGFTVKERREVGASPLEEVAFLSLGDTLLELLRVANASSSPLDSWRSGYRMMALEVDEMDKASVFLTGVGEVHPKGRVYYRMESANSLSCRFDKPRPRSARDR